MHRLKRILLKFVWLADCLAGPFYRIYLLIVRGVDVSFFADVRPHQFRNLKFGRNIIIEKDCMLDATEKTKIDLGDNVIIQRNTQLLNYSGKGIRVGKNTTINRYCLLYGRGGLEVGDDCLIGPHCVFVPSNHRFDDTTRRINAQGDTHEGITVGSNIWFGAGVIVLDGVIIGDNCVIGAGSVVTRSIPANSVAAGAPAKVVRRRGERPARAAERAVCATDEEEPAAVLAGTD